MECPWFSMCEVGVSGEVVFSMGCVSDRFLEGIGGSVIPMSAFDKLVCLSRIVRHVVVAGEVFIGAQA